MVFRAPEVVPYCDEQIVFSIDSAVQTDPMLVNDTDDSSSSHDTDETSRLLYYTEPSTETINCVRENIQQNEHASPSYHYECGTNMPLRDTDETTSLLSHNDVPAETINYGSNRVNDKLEL